jgi:hypothetical protein
MAINVKGITAKIIIDPTSQRMFRHVDIEGGTRKQRAAQYRDELNHHASTLLTGFPLMNRHGIPIRIGDDSHAADRCLHRFKTERAAVSL